MADLACTFAATPGPLYSNFQKVTSQPGCCVTDPTGTITSAFGLNNTCHVLSYQGSAAPYRLTQVLSNAGNLSMTNGDCVAMVLNIANTGEYATGNGTGPSDAGLATRYGYDGCVVGVRHDKTSICSRLTCLGIRPRRTRVRHRRRRPRLVLSLY